MDGGLFVFGGYCCSLEIVVKSLDLNLLVLEL